VTLCALCGRGLSGSSTVLTVDTGKPGERSLDFCSDASGCRRAAFDRFVSMRGRNMPIPTSYAVVADVLGNMAESVASRDSFEGSIEYLMPDVPEWAQRGEPRPEGFEDVEVLMRCSYRIGNSMGQGGLRVYGSINETSEAAP
jgi:hypothetical protein